MKQRILPLTSGFAFNECLINRPAAALSTVSVAYFKVHTSVWMAKVGY
jgi:hypothetical protein